MRSLVSLATLRQLWLCSLVLLSSAAPAYGQSLSETLLSNVLANNVLVNDVSKQLNINRTQSAGGIGSLLQMAGQAVSSKEFSILKKAIPDAEALIAKAPSLPSTMSDTSAFSEDGLLGSLGPITSQFSALGLNSNNIAPLIQIVLGFLSQQKSTEAYNILHSAIPSDLLDSAVKSLMNAW